MRKLFFSVALFLSFSISYGQAGFIEPTDGPGDCPPGTHPVISYSCDLKFHRPKYGCLKGFGLCFRDCMWTVKCVSNSGYYKNADALNRLPFYIECGSTEFTFHFPVSLKADKEYAETDLATFSMDEPLAFLWQGVKYQLVTGDYATSQNEFEIIAKVPVIKP